MTRQGLIALVDAELHGLWPDAELDVQVSPQDMADFVRCTAQVAEDLVRVTVDRRALSDTARALLEAGR